MGAKLLALGAAIKAGAAAVGAFVTANAGIIAIASLTLAIGSTYVQARAQKKAQEKAKEALAIDALRPTTSAQGVNIAYGRCALRGILAYATTADTFTENADEVRRIGVIRLEQNFNYRNEYLLTQWVISAGAIDRVLDVWESDRPTKRGDLANLIETEWRTDGVASEVAKRFTSEMHGNGSEERGDNDTFTGLSYATNVARLSPNNPQFFATPELLFFVRGRTVRGITSAGFGTESYSNNAVLVLADYLTNNMYGPNFDDDVIDVETFAAAAAIAGTEVQGATSLIWNSDYPDYLNTINSTQWDRFRDYLRNLGFDTIDDTGIITGISGAPSETPVVRIDRYEFNGVLPTTRDFLTVSDTILEVMPGAKLFRATSGKWKLVLPDSTRLASAQSVATITQDDFVGKLTVNYPDSSQKLNSMTVRYRNINEDFAEDSVTYPQRGGSLDQYWLAEDGGVRLHSTDTVEGIHNKYAAASYAATAIQILRMPTYQFVMHGEGWLLEPGDVIRLRDSTLGLDTYMRVDTVSVSSTLEVTVVGVEFDPANYAWTSDEKEVLDAQQADDKSLGVVQTLTATEEDNLVSLAWVAAETEDVNISGYEIQETVDGGTTWQATLLTSLDARTATTFVGIGAVTAKWRIRPVGIEGRRGQWTESNSLEIAEIDIEGSGGEDGLGVEYVFARTAGDVTAIPMNQLPLNTWGFDSPVAVGGLTWADAAQSVTEAFPILWRAERRVTGQPDVGDAVTAQWTTPIILSRFGVDGIVGADGTDGAGVEYVFARTAATVTAIATGDLPNNMWGYDSPTTAGTLMWSDGAPSLSQAEPVLWRAQRMVMGVPEVGDEVEDMWTTPVIVGRFGEQGIQGIAGADGTDGAGHEYIFAATAATVESIPTGSLPVNSWGYDSPTLAGSITWSDGAPSLSDEKPVLWRAERRIVGAPAVGDAVADNWSTPAIVGWRGARGVAGADGDDGQGSEFVFTVSDTASIPPSKRPNNSWGYDSPGTADGQVWSDGAPTLTGTNRYLWRAQRRVQGVPATGATVADNWTSPIVVGRWGDKGDKGDVGPAGADGTDGDGRDGIGIEWIFTINNSATLATSRRPNNSWGYDSPGTSGGQVWSDAAPNLTSTNRYLWRAERRITGQPDVGDAVSENWSMPSIVGRWGDKGDRGLQGIQGADGTDGEDGETGEDGIGIEYQFRTTSTSTTPTGPSNSVGYDIAVSPWSDGAPTLTESQPYLWQVQRRVPGGTAVGAAVTDTWTTPALVSHYGADGNDGIDGTDGTDGTPGQDGIGFEYQFRTTTTSARPAGPSNSVGFDSPVAPWTDGASSVSESQPYLWRVQRRVPASANVGDAVTDRWSTPVLISRYGTDGTDGTDGDDGEPGANWWPITSGTVPPTSTGVNGDFAIMLRTGNAVNGDLYYKASNVWGKTGNILGPSGTDGTDGTDGDDGEPGANWWPITSGTVPPTATGVNGDFAIILMTGNAANGDLYYKANNAWSKTGNILGPRGVQGTDGDDGEPGANWWPITTATVPPSATGVNGDFAIILMTGNDANGDLYYKSSDTWSKTGNILGPQGIQGLQGTDGEDGDDGVPGALWYVVRTADTPATSVGVNGDLALVTNNGANQGNVYLKTNNAWGLVGNIKGPQGPQGISGGFSVWALGTAYAIGDGVFVQGGFVGGEPQLLDYVCIRAHTATNSNKPGSGSSASTYWRRA